MPTFDTAGEIAVLQARILRYQQALDDMLTGRMRSSLESSTGTGSSRVGYYRPEVEALREELARATSRLAMLQGDRCNARRSFTL